MMSSMPLAQEVARRPRPAVRDVRRLVAEHRGVRARRCASILRGALERAAERPDEERTGERVARVGAQVELGVHPDAEQHAVGGDGGLDVGALLACLAADGEVLEAVLDPLHRAAEVDRRSDRPRPRRAGTPFLRPKPPPTSSASTRIFSIGTSICGGRSSRNMCGDCVDAWIVRCSVAASYDGDEPAALHRAPAGGGAPRCSLARRGRPWRRRRRRRRSPSRCSTRCCRRTRRTAAASTGSSASS